LVSPVRSLFRDDPWSSLTRVNIGHERSSAQAPEQPLPVQLDLLERDTELAAVTGLIAATPGGGRLLAIEGPPGIGKTALMAAAKALAQEAGLQVLAARGSELERSFSYGVVRQLFEPLLASVQAEERADLLAGSAAFAAPLFDSAQVAADPAVDSSLATLHGLYWLTANLAARRPLLLAVDDLHWCDLPSLRWLAYLLPRMEGLGLLVVVGLRPAEPGEDPGLIGQIVSDPLATTVRPAPLSTEAVARLLRESLSPDADDAFCAACEEATGGNPLLLRELVHTIADEGLAPTEANVPRLRDLAARAGSRAVSLRLSRLPPETTTLAQAVAILGDARRPGRADRLRGGRRARAGSCGASESAVAYLRRALAEPPLAAERADLLLELGSAETLVDGDAAVEHLREAHALIDDPIRRAETANLLGRQLFLLRGEEADAVFTQALVELAGADAELERLLEAGLIISTIFVPSLHRAALERLARVRNRPADATFGEKLLLAQVAYDDARAGTPAAVAVPLARRALAEGMLVREDVDSAAFVLAATVLAMADLDEALAVYEDALAQAHRRGSTFAFAITKVFRAQTFVFRGDLAEAEAEGREALAAGEAWGTTARFLGPHSAGFLAEALMEQGKLDDAAAALARAGIGESLPDDARLLFFPDVRAHLRMLKGDLAGGLEEMLDTGRRFEAVGSRNPAFMAWRSPAALALLQLGEQDEASRLAAEELSLARTWGAPPALGAALRAAGLVEGGEHGLGLLEEAVQVLSNSPAKLEQAKARTELGAALRRANRRSEAREQLRRGARASDDLRRRASRRTRRD
jgi:tetratricopeptide (TPR) repeat protein